MPKHDTSQVPEPTPEQMARLESLMHRVQSAVAFFEGQKETFGIRHTGTEPKHLRVGVNSALIETSTLARLMFRKGLITQEEYFDTLIESWEEEVDSYRTMVKKVDPRIDI